MRRFAFAVLLAAGAAHAQIPNFQLTNLNTPAASQQAVDAFGTVWMVDPAANSLGRIDLTTGVYTAVPVPADEHALLYNLAATPDGSVWYADYGHPIVGRRSAKGAFFQYSVPNNPYLIAGGSDSGVFFNYLQKPTVLGHLSAGGGKYQQFNLPSGAVVENLTVGWDGAAYFTDLRANHRIVRVGPDGAVKSFPVAAANPPVSFTWYPGIANGPDGNLWFTHATSIGRLRLSDGAVTEYPIPYANADASGITAGGDGNVWFADSFAGAGVVSQLVVSTATDEGHATINASPGIGEPIGILAVAAEPLPPGPEAFSVQREAVLADACPDAKFVVELNIGNGPNLSLARVARGGTCAELEVSILEMRPAVDNPREVLLALVVTNFGPDPAENVNLVMSARGADGVVFRFPGWNCNDAAGVPFCSRTGAMPAGRADLGELDFTLATSALGLEASGKVYSDTPDPTPDNLFSANSGSGAFVNPKLIPPPPAPVPPVSRKLN